MLTWNFELYLLKWKGSICCQTVASVLPLWWTVQVGPKRKLKVSQPHKKNLPSGRFSCWPPASRPPPTPSQPRRWPSWCPPWWGSPPAAGSHRVLFSALLPLPVRLRDCLAAQQSLSKHTHTHRVCCRGKGSTASHSSTFLVLYLHSISPLML